MKFAGDIVLTIPVIRSVREAYPDAFIAYMGDSRAVELLEHGAVLDEIIPFDFSRPTLLEQPRVASILFRRKFDLVIDLFGNPRSALLTWLSRARVRVGPDRRVRGLFYTVRVRDDRRRKTAIEFHFQALRAAGIRPVPCLPEIVLRDDERKQAQRILAGILGTPAGGNERRPLVALHAGATWPAKQWFPRRCALLADRLAKNKGAAVVLTGGPADTAVVEEVRTLSRSKPPFTGLLTLRQLAAVLSHCHAVVANDGAPMHIAAAVGAPVIGLFGPGEEDVWFPYESTVGHLALRCDVPCHPCHLNICNRPGAAYMECMKLLSVDQVMDAVGRVISAPR
jgi:lipopolysaccharide heptosyltransferase II